VNDGVLRLRIAVDGSDIIPATMERASAAVEEHTSQISGHFKEAGEASRQMGGDISWGLARIAPAAEEAEYSVTEAKHALHGLGEEIGVHIPRFVQGFVAEMPAVGSALSAAFSAVAVIGLIQVLAELPEAFRKIEESVTGWDETAKKAYEHQIEINQKYLDLIRETARAQQELNLVGKTGSDEKKTALQIEVSETQKNIDELHAGQVKVAADMKTLSELEEQSGFHLRDLLNPGMRLFANHIAGTSDEMKRLQTEIQKTTDKNIALDLAIRKSQQQTQPKVKAEENTAQIEEAKKAADERAAIEKRFNEITAELNLKHQQELLASIQKVNADEEAATADRLKRGFAAVEESGRIIDAYNRDQRQKEKHEQDELVALLDKVRNEEIARDIQAREEAERRKIQIYRMEQAEIAAQQKVANTYLKQIDANFNQHVMSWVTGQETIKQSLEQSWNSIASNAIQNLARMAEQQILYHALGIELEKKGILVQAKSAAAHAFTSVMKALPFPADVIVAPIAAAGAFAGVAAFGSFDQGGIVPNTGMHMLHKKEMVLDERLSTGIQQAILGGRGGSRSGDVNLNYNAHGAGSPADHKRNAADIVKIIKREQRRGALPSA
jgi:hypothetical protein